MGKPICSSSASRSRNSSSTSSTTSLMRASGRSTLLTTRITGSRASSALRRTKRVWGSGPSDASTRSSTPSTMVSPRSTSPPKSACPGVSTMLSLTPPWRTAVFLARIVMPFSRSRSIESMTRSATSWLARNAPDCHSIASTSVVLPWSTWATMATLRRPSTGIRSDTRARVGPATEGGRARAARPATPPSRPRALAQGDDPVDVDAGARRDVLLRAEQLDLDVVLDAGGEAVGRPHGGRALGLRGGRVHVDRLPRAAVDGDLRLAHVRAERPDPREVAERRELDAVELHAGAARRREVHLATPRRRVGLDAPRAAPLEVHGVAVVDAHDRELAGGHPRAGQPALERADAVLVLRLVGERPDLQGARRGRRRQAAGDRRVGAAVLALLQLVGHRRAGGARLGARAPREGDGQRARRHRERGRGRGTDGDRLAQRPGRRHLDALGAQGDALEAVVGGVVGEVQARRALPERGARVEADPDGAARARGERRRAGARGDRERARVVRAGDVDGVDL